MSYSINEGIEHTQNKAASLQAIQEFDSNAYFSDGRWVSSELSVSDCDEIEVHNGEIGGPFIRYYKNFGVVRLYPSSFEANDYLGLIFQKLRSKNPEKFKGLVETLRSGEFKL
jgi:hypothetical protein